MSLSAYRTPVRLNATRLFFSARQNGTVAANRQIHNLLQQTRRQNVGHIGQTAPSSPPQDFSPSLTILRLSLPSTRKHLFSSGSVRFQTQQSKEDIKDPPRPEQNTEQKPGEEQEASEGSTGDKSGDKGKQEEKKKEEEKAPPPPHGDKTPWQVFTETLQTEFKASKEWNESTKALASSAHQFTENESVKKARAAYTGASDAVGSKTATAFKTTGKALGQGAAWTWDTAPVKGVRIGASALGRGLDKATKPVRDTAAYKSVKDVIDDGSSSRYGGWQEKEERRKARELRELNELRSGRRPMEKAEEDPK